MIQNRFIDYSIGGPGPCYEVNHLVGVKGLKLDIHVVDVVPVWVFNAVLFKPIQIEVSEEYSIWCEGSFY